MEICMIYPDIRSEKGISKYSTDIIENVEKQGIKIRKITYMQGKPKTFFTNWEKIKQCDIIHLQHEYNLLGWFGIPFYVFFAYFWLFTKKPLITTMHTVFSKKEKLEHSKLKLALLFIFYRTKNWIIKKSSAKVIVHSKYFKKILVDEFGFPKNKVEYIPHAIIEDIKAIPKEKAKKKLNLKGRTYLMIGTMNPYHDYEAVVNQADKLDKTGTLLIVTSTSAVNYRNTEKLENALNRIKQAIKKKKLEGNVRLEIGFVPYKKWWEYFSAADLVILPYKGGVGSGIFSDAMAMKKPVIASNVPYFSTIAKDYGCVKIVKTNTEYPKIISEAMKPKNYKKMITECNRYFKENGLTPISRIYKKLYHSLE